MKMPKSIDQSANYNITMEIRKKNKKSKTVYRTINYINDISAMDNNK